MSPDSAVATGSAPAGHDPGVVKAPRSVAAKSFYAFGNPFRGGNDVLRIAVLIATRSEAAKHCLDDGRIAPRGANHSQSGVWDESR
jgi:hypothetical protein